MSDISGTGLPAVCLAVTAYLGCDRILAVVMLTLAGACSGFVMSGYGVNHLDLAPPFAGKYTVEIYYVHGVN